jgi:hypothetical protein
MVCEIGERVHTYGKLIIVEDMNTVALLGAKWTEGPGRCSDRLYSVT